MSLAPLLSSSSSFSSASAPPQPQTASSSLQPSATLINTNSIFPRTVITINLNILTAERKSKKRKKHTHCTLYNESRISRCFLLRKKSWRGYVCMNLPVFYWAAFRQGRAPPDNGILWRIVHCVMKVVGGSAPRAHGHLFPELTWESMEKLFHTFCGKATFKLLQKFS